MPSHRAERRRVLRRPGEATQPAARVGRHRAPAGHAYRTRAASVIGLAALSAAAVTAATGGHDDPLGPEGVTSLTSAAISFPIPVTRGGRYERVSRNADRQALAMVRQERIERREARERRDARQWREAREQRQARRQHQAHLKRQAQLQAQRRAASIAARQWVLPLQGYSLTAHFGEVSSLWATTHTGLDFAAATGTPVASVAAGVVRQTGYFGAYGNRVVVGTADGTDLWFCHLDTILVNVGEQLVAGQQLGTVGYTGNTTGSHLHLEVRLPGGTPVDPYTALLNHGLQP